MSEILPDFVRPFADSVEDVDDFRRLLTLGTLAWNAALVPEPRRQQMIDDVLSKGLGKEKAAFHTPLNEMVSQLVARKLRYFAAYARPIVGFTVEDDGKGYYVQVMSVLS
jgi:hypothetical protein